MQSLSPFIPTTHLPTPANPTQLLPPEAHSDTPLTQPQIHTLWLHALSLHNPLTLSFRSTITAHKYLLKHLLHSPSSPAHLTVPVLSTCYSHQLDNRNGPDSLSVRDLKNPAHSPHAFFLFLNLGILSAFTGEYFLATRHFHTALGVDDGAVPGNTAVGHYLLGVAFFELGQYPKATRAFHQCLILFRRKNIMDGRPELVAAAPWVSPLAGAGEEEKKVKKTKKEGEDGEGEEEEGTWTGFKHKIYEPTAASSSSDDAKQSWMQWDLERKNVDENLQAAITASGLRPKSRAVQDDRSTGTVGVHGIPGGALFWPIEEGRIQDPAHPKAKRPSSKTTKPVPPALGVEGNKDEAIGLGLQVPSRQALLIPTPDVQGPKWNEQTQRWEDYVSPLTPLSRATSKRQQQRLPGLDYSAASKLEDKGNNGDDDGVTTPKASGFARVQHGEQIVPADMGFSASSSSSNVEFGAGDPSRKENQGVQPLQRKTRSPSSYTTSPPTTIGSSFLSYYGHTPSQESEKYLSEKASQSLRPALPRPAFSAEEKHRSAWLALNGLEDDEAEDTSPLSPQPLFGTRKTTDTPGFGSRGSRSADPKDEGSTLSPRRRTIIHHNSPYPSTATPTPSPRFSTFEASATQRRPNIPATPSAVRPFPPRISSLSPIPQTPGSAISETPSRSPTSAVLSIYGSLTPPDTATTYLTDASVFTPTSDFPTPTFPPKPTRPAPTPPPTARTAFATATPAGHLPRIFSASPLNHHSRKRTGPSKSEPRGLGIGIAGLAGPEPAIGLEEAMRVRERREEQGREVERERREVEKEYREWMRRVEEEQEEEEGEEGGEILLPRVFEGFGVRKGKGKGVEAGAKTLEGVGAKGESGAGDGGKGVETTAKTLKEAGPKGESGAGDGGKGVETTAKTLKEADPKGESGAGDGGQGLETTAKTLKEAGAKGESGAAAGGKVASKPLKEPAASTPTHAPKSISAPAKPPKPASTPTTTTTRGKSAPKEAEPVVQKTKKEEKAPVREALEQFPREEEGREGREAEREWLRRVEEFRGS